MDQHIYDLATDLVKRREEAIKELEVWESEIKRAEDVAYVGFNNQPKKFTFGKSAIPNEVFQGARRSIINALKIVIAELSDELDRL